VIISIRQKLEFANGDIQAECFGIKSFGIYNGRKISNIYEKIMVCLSPINGRKIE